MTSKQELPAVLGAPAPGDRTTAGCFFGFGSEPGLRRLRRRSSRSPSPAGSACPTATTTSRTTTKSKEIRAQVRRARREDARAARRRAGGGGAQTRTTVMAIETALAKASLTRVERAIRTSSSTRSTVSGLQALTPAFDWKRVPARGRPRARSTRSTSPSRSSSRSSRRSWRARSLDDLKIYLRWHAAHAIGARYLSSRLRRRELRLLQQDAARRARSCRRAGSAASRWVDRELGEALGQEFVRSARSPPELKASTLRDDAADRAGDGERHQGAGLDERRDQGAGAGEAARDGQQDRLSGQVARLQRAARSRRGDFAGNVERARCASSRGASSPRSASRVDRGEWGMTPPTVNAYYDPQMNDINFPAGRAAAAALRPEDGRRAQLRQHRRHHRPRADARLRRRGPPVRRQGQPARTGGRRRTREEFEKRAQCIVDQYAQYTVVDDIKINSKLTLGEDVADLGGTDPRLHGLEGRRPRARSSSRATGLTPEQRFFVGFAQWACDNERPENKRVQRAHRPALAARSTAINGRRREHAGVREGVRLQAGPADGARESLPGLVALTAWQRQAPAGWLAKMLTPTHGYARCPLRRVSARLRPIASEFTSRSRFAILLTVLDQVSRHAM